MSGVLIISAPLLFGLHPVGCLQFHTLSSTATMMSSTRRPKTWFNSLFGFDEEQSFVKNKSKFRLEDGFLISSERPDSRHYVGEFTLPSVAELREHVRLHAADTDSSSPIVPRGLSYSNLSDNVTSLIADPSNRGALFQAASQCNCLEMPGPGVSPARGVATYSHDLTQGPACAIACPAATVARNYLYTESPERQMDTLRDMGEVLSSSSSNDDDDRPYWTMRNGYALPADRSSLSHLSERLRRNDDLVARCEASLRIGVHWDTSVSPLLSSSTLDHRVAQAFCSALPVAYAAVPTADWEVFARLVLRAAYDATLLVGRQLAASRGERVTVYLTKLGDGAFGNDTRWVVDAVQAALDAHRDAPLDVVMVHFARSRWMKTPRAWAHVK